MNFRTEYKPKSSALQLSLDRPLAMLGSCFTDYMGTRFRKHLWQACNPCGVLFNPLSIARILSMLTEPAEKKQEIIEASIFKAGDLWHSWLGDTSFSATTPEKVVHNITVSLQLLDTLLTNGRTLVVTMGTAWCYFLKNTSDVVANCHKQPSALFDRKMVYIETIIALWGELLENLRSHYEGLQVIFTVSPVRHVRDGLHENACSKATLTLAVDSLCRRFNYCHYFPAYEILLDDLRDYRFYAADMVHPSEQAVEYIKEKFCDTYFSATELKTLQEGESIFRRLSHRAINPDSAETTKFKEESLRLYADFLSRHPNALYLENGCL